MRIEENKIFIFKFPYESHEITIPIQSETRELAVQKLQDYFQQWGMELSMAMPKIAPLPETDLKKATLEAMEIGVPTTELLSLQIDDELKRISKNTPLGGNLQAVIKKLTGFKYEPENYAAILDVLKKQQ